MIRTTTLFILLSLLGCREDYKRHLSQFGGVDTGMKRVNVKFSNRVLPIHCGDLSSEAGEYFESSKAILTGREIINELSNKTQISKGLYLYANIDNNVYVIAPIPHDRYPVSDIFLKARGKFENNGKVLYMQTVIGVEEYDEFSELVINGVIKQKCFE